MAKGGNNQKSNGSRFSKPYDVSNSFVKKVALRVSDYLGGLFGSSVKSDDSTPGDKTSFRGADINLPHSHYEAPASGKSVGIPGCYDELCINDSPGKLLKIGSKRKFISDLPISPIGSSSSLFQSSVNHNFDIQNNNDSITSVAGPSGLQSQKYAQTNSITTPTSTNTNLKANGTADNHSDSSESTSGCSSLVPQSDRLSQSAFVSSSRKKILEEKLQYARQLKQTRASMFLNRSIPVVSDTTGSRRKPSFDVSIYGSHIIDKSSVREKMVNSPFYTGQTSYGGASAYRKPKTALYSQCGKPFERRDGLQIQVKPSNHGSTEDLSNMSHTAKRILEALEQFSTPISDAKRIPVSGGTPPLGRKRRRVGDSMESVASFSSSKTVGGQTKGPLISGLSIPTIPDLLKLKRLEKIQDSTAAARQVAVKKQEYSLPTDIQSSKHSGKIVTKLKDKEKEVAFERPPEVNLPKIPLPISSLPKFDLKLPTTPTSTAESPASSKPTSVPGISITPGSKNSDPNTAFEFSPPVVLVDSHNVKSDVAKSATKNSNSDNSFKFSPPVNVSDLQKPVPKPKVQCEPPLSELPLAKKKADQWECSVCLIRNKDSDLKCAACESPKPGAKLDKPEPPKFGFGIPAEASSFKFGIDKADVSKDSKATDLPKPVLQPPSNPLVSDSQSKPKPFSSVVTSVGVFTFGIPSAATSEKSKIGKEADEKPDSPKASKPIMTTEAEKSQDVGVTEPSTKPDAPSAQKENSDKPDKSEKIVEAEKKVVEQKPAESKINEFPKSTLAPAKNFVINQFSFDAHSKPTSMGLFSFGSNTAKPPVTTSEDTAKTINQPVTTSAFGSGFKIPETLPSTSTSSASQPPSFVNSQATVTTSVATSGTGGDVTKSPPLPAFTFTGKTDIVSAPSVLFPEATKSPENIAATTASNIVATTTTNSVFGPSVFGASKTRISFGGSSFPNFGGPFDSSKMFRPAVQPSFTSSAPSFTSSAPSFTSSTSFTSSAPSFTSSAPSFTSSAPSFTSSAPSFSSSAPSFTSSAPFSSSAPSFSSSAPSFTTAAPFTSSAPSAPSFTSSAPSFTSSTPTFGNPNHQATGFGMFNCPVNTFGSTPAFGSNPTPTPTLGNAFGQPASIPQKPVTPFIFGESNNNAASMPASIAPAAPVAPAAPTTASNLFTFGAAKPQFSSFGQSSSNFTFGSPSNNTFGGFEQPKQANPFGTPNTTFGSPAGSLFGNNSAPVSLGSKFTFNASSQQAQSSPQPFQFGAVVPQNQPSSAPATTFSTSIPSKFNFTRGQAPTTFSATPEIKAEPQRRLAKPFRRTKR